MLSPPIVYIAKDALELIDVDYEPLEPVMDAKRAMEPGAPIIRDDKGQQDNSITDVHGHKDWESGNAIGTRRSDRCSSGRP